MHALKEGLAYTSVIWVWFAPSLPTNPGLQGMVFTVPFLADEYVSVVETEGQHIESMRMWGMGGDAVPLELVKRMEEVSLLLRSTGFAVPSLMCVYLQSLSLPPHLFGRCSPISSP